MKHFPLKQTPVSVLAGIAFLWFIGVVRDRLDAVDILFVSLRGERVKAEEIVGLPDAG